MRESTLRDGLLEGTARRLRVEHEGQVPHCLTLDVDSLPVEVYGHQPGSEYNGHYHATIYHPLIATLGELGDLVGVRRSLAVDVDSDRRCSRKW